jgi:hypothetical protein
MPIRLRPSFFFLMLRSLTYKRAPRRELLCRDFAEGDRKTTLQCRIERSHAPQKLTGL